LLLVVVGVVVLLVVEVEPVDYYRQLAFQWL
jgi:hypothetical protein